MNTCLAFTSTNVVVMSVMVLFQDDWRLRSDQPGGGSGYIHIVTWECLCILKFCECLFCHTLSWVVSILILFPRVVFSEILCHHLCLFLHYFCIFYVMLYYQGVIGQIWKKLICNSLIIPGSSMYDAACLLRQSVSKGADITGYCKHDTIHFFLWPTSC